MVFDTAVKMNGKIKYSKIVKQTLSSKRQSDILAANLASLAEKAQQKLQNSHWQTVIRILYNLMGHSFLN